MGNIEGFSPAHRLAQAWRREQGHDGLVKIRAHALGRPDRSAEVLADGAAMLTGIAHGISFLLELILRRKA